MAWPFTAVTAPNRDSGSVTLTGSYADVPTFTAGTFGLKGLFVVNPTAAAIQLFVQDASANPIIPGMWLAAGQVYQETFTAPEFASKPQWKGAGLVAKMEGWQ